jgi:hypothetical protein
MNKPPTNVTSDLISLWLMTIIKLLGAKRETISDVTCL